MNLDALRARATLTRDGYKVFDGEYAAMSPTLEDAEFLYALVRVTKPALVLELGTGLGVSACFLASALAENDNVRGADAEAEPAWLLTVEPNHYYAELAREGLHGLPCSVLEGNVRPLIKTPDLVFIDSGYDRREADIEHWLTAPFDGLVCVHDAGRGYPGLALGTGVYLPGSDGLWLGRAK